MARAAAEAEFLAFSAQSRALIGGCALLLAGDPVRADRLAQSVLARRLAGRVGEGLLTAAWRELVRPRPRFANPPWVSSARVELVDTTQGPPPPRLLAELQELLPEARAVLVLTVHAGLTSAEVAAVLGVDVATVERWGLQAREQLATRRPERRQPEQLAAELAAAAGHAGPSGDPSADLAHGRQLLRRRALQRASALVAAALVVVLTASTVLDRNADVPQAAGSAPVATATATPSGSLPVTADCDIRNPTCQATVMRAWRNAMSDAVVAHLDPGRRYFTGYSFSYDQRYDSPDFWRGGPGALGLEVFRLDGGATEVYVQVATGYDTAIRCGATTGRRCQQRRFLDGEPFRQTSTTTVQQGIEVQHRPDGLQVVTVVARNTTRGRVLEVSRADLLALVQDPRLRLPVI